MLNELSSVQACFNDVCGSTFHFGSCGVLRRNVILHGSTEFLLSGGRHADVVCVCGAFDILTAL